MIRRLIRSALLRAVIPALDSAILWAFGWRKERVDGVGCGPHYIDPLNPDGDLLLRDAAVAVACNRARWEAERARKAAKRAAQENRSQP
jgi:hypothetical protein